ncbi:Peptidyl-prolyl cis-trans isomerase Fpr3/Fpr4-like protein [Dioscorea alata]|uniref:Peptidyl-prolyl cis-trans isomerase Fpr3/Fpr4-like protein n=1 Tax=Dioscorea alata TaxID=55571 RepID=A0ACB7WIR0_DIOAL|nr:Peptidyl-prolyl cis-trans isomerase Fpr3/Fpr4-like protein [Dioscorea alata]
MPLISSPSLFNPTLAGIFEPVNATIRFSSRIQKNQLSRIEREGNGSRRGVLIFMIPLLSSGLLASLSASGKVKGSNPYNEKRLLEQNKKMQAANNVPNDFPSFIREGFQVKVVASDNYQKRDSGLMYLDIEVGNGDCPRDGQQIIFHYIGYNESGRRIDSTYLQGFTRQNSAWQ